MVSRQTDRQTESYPDFARARRGGKTNLDISNGNSFTIDGNTSQDGILFDIDDGSIIRRNGTGSSGGISVGESHGSKVSEIDERLAFGEIFDDPFGIGFAEFVGLVAEGLGDGDAGGFVFDHGGAAAGAGCGDGGFDHVSCGDADVEVIGVGGVPFVPCIVGHGAVGDGEVDARLEDRGLACVTVDADPGGGGVAAIAGFARGDGWGGDGEGSGYCGVATADEDGSSPVLAVFHIAVVGAFDLGRDGTVGCGNHGLAATCGTVSSTSKTSCSTGTTLLGEWCCQDAAGKQSTADEGSGELHLGDGESDDWEDVGKTIGRSLEAGMEREKKRLNGVLKKRNLERGWLTEKRRRSSKGRRREMFLTLYRTGPSNHDIKS